jgi:hypothetical protein
MSGSTEKVGADTGGAMDTDGIERRIGRLDGLSRGLVSPQASAARLRFSDLSVPITEITCKIRHARPLPGSLSAGLPGRASPGVGCSRRAADADHPQRVQAMAASAILLVADDRDSCASRSDIISDLGYPVGVASDGPTALERARRQPSGLALLDDKMPGINGVELNSRRPLGLPLV